MNSNLPTTSPSSTLLLEVSGIEAAVCADIARRQKHGLAKYGVTVADNPLPLRPWLQHAYEESLDHCVYLKRAMAQMDASDPPVVYPSSNPAA